MKNIFQILLSTLFLLIGIADVVFANGLAGAAAPESAALTLVGLGLLCIAGVSKRKK